MKKITVLIAGIFVAGMTLQAQDATTLLNEGVVLKNQKKVVEALDKFKKALALKPDYTEAMYEMGWCQNDLKEYTSAIASLRKARVGWPTIPKVHFELGYAFDKNGNTDSAIASLQKCLQYKTDYSLAWKQLGTIYYNKDKIEDALLCFNSYERAAKDSIKDYLYFYRKGFCYNAAKKYDSAITPLNRASQLKSDYLNTWLELGFAYSRLKKLDESITYYKKAITVDAKSHVAYNGIGEVYRDYKKDMNEAMTWYLKALEVKPKERKACFGMGYCLNSQQKYTDAIPYLRTAIAEEATYTAAWVELGYSLFKTGAYTEAEEKLKQALVLNSKNENARYYLVLMYVAQKNKARAQEQVDELKKNGSKYVAELQTKVNAL